LTVALHPTNPQQALGVRIDAVQLAALDQRGEDGPVLGTLVREVVMMRLSSLWRAKGIARGRI